MRPRPSAAARVTLSHRQARHGLVQVCHVAGLVLVERDRRGLSRHLVGGGDGRCCVRLLAGFEVGAAAADPRVLQHLGDCQALLGRLDQRLQKTIQGQPCRDVCSDAWLI